MKTKYFYFKINGLKLWIKQNKEMKIIFKSNIILIILKFYNMK